MIEIEILYDEFKNSQERNFETFSKYFSDDINKFQQLFDLQQKLFHIYLPATDDAYYEVQEYERIVVQSYLKATHLIFTVSQLILHGDYGAARILMRQIFEYLIVGKYLHTKKANADAEKWLEERQFDVYDRIIKLLKVPDKKYIFEFWKILSSQAHAGNNSLQIGLNEEMNMYDMVASLHINMILLCCKGSLLTKNFINAKLNYNVNKYGHKKEEVKELRLQLKKTEKEVLNLFTNDGIDLINDYKKKWIFKK